MIKDKRDQLQQFISEQILGPGISGYRFVDLNDELLMTGNVLNFNPIKYNNELINIVPAGVYSTGILFPLNSTNSEQENGFVNELNKEDVQDNELYLEATSLGPSIKESDESSIEEEETLRIDQMFPNSIGISCCFDADNFVFEKLKMRVQARYYSKINPKENDFNTKYGVICECNALRFNKFLLDNGLSERFLIVVKGENSVLTVSQLSTVELSALKQLIRQIIESEAGAIKQKYNEYNYNLKVNSLSSLKQWAFFEMNQCLDISKRQKLYIFSQEVEEIENFLAHCNDILEINDSRSYGLWRSNPIDIEVPFIAPLPKTIKGKIVFNHLKYDTLHDIICYTLPDEEKASLSINLQLSTDSRKGNVKIFLKVQLVNTSTPFARKENDSRYYSMFNEEVNKKCFFGVKILLASDMIIPYNNIDFTSSDSLFDEDDVTKYNYRQFEDYGIGHNCSVKWDKSKKTIETEYIPICDIPDVDPIPKNKEKIIEKNGIYEPALFLGLSQTLQFKWLSSLSDVKDEEILLGLHSFVNAYASWIELKKGKYSKLISEPERKLVFQELEKCSDDRKRMTKNINSFLKDDKNKLNSFRLMNSAMFMQLWHSVKVKNDQIKDFIDDKKFSSFDLEFYKNLDDRLFTKDESAAWRAFQLAFILLNLDGIFKPEDDAKWEKRNEWVDLVWFPTGGGKTEAYLGIIALTIINRRKLYKEKGGGTAAIMRYTLRLLTLQQFQRATLVIMALELLRRWNLFDLGIEPIYIGLWVGDNSLPNKMLPANRDDKNNLLSEFDKIRNGLRSKVPFDSCPWCKSKLRPSNTRITDSDNVFQYNRLQLHCDNDKCSFTEADFFEGDCLKGSIPVCLCDEEIYQHPPSLLFGTVDKFAQLAHKVSNKEDERNKDSRRIFGKGNWEKGKPCNGYLPPDLIIQDELHLLLGPLGSAVALFESAVDQLCCREDGTRPKVISSTATTRNTGLQIMALFDRKVNLFPKPGVECDDSFFAFYKRYCEDSKCQKDIYISKRRYIGILPTGRTQIWMQMRLAAILLTHRAVFELQQIKNSNPLDFGSYKDFSKSMDYFHTIVSYFNSLKEVGKTESQIQSYILKEIRRVFNRVMRPSKLMHSFYTYSIKEGELTGRLSGEEVKNELDKVQIKWKAESRFPQEIDGERVRGNLPPDFIVATNMISVGIDVSRFNSIIINSMPRNIAEYIQASSRVARESYGLVFTLHHPFRSRDISHYEKYIEFHEKMYSYVEPISITPFTRKAVDRYLGLYLATIIRHTTEFVNRTSANQISSKNDAQIEMLVYQLLSYFEKRKVHLSNSDVDLLSKNLLKTENVLHIGQWIRDAIKDWKNESDRVLADNKKFVFKNKSKKSTIIQEQLYVDIEEYEGNIHSYKWQVPMSLRVIEPEAAIKINRK